MSVEDKTKKIKLVVLDVDGVLTDGQIVTGSQGELCKHFDVKDGLGIKMLLAAGIDVVVITGRRSAIVGARLRELGVRDVFQGQSYKKGAFLDLIQARHLDASECACMGDDIPDLPVLQLVLPVLLVQKLPVLFQPFQQEPVLRFLRYLRYSYPFLCFLLSANAKAV